MTLQTVQAVRYALLGGPFPVPPAQGAPPVTITIGHKLTAYTAALARETAAAAALAAAKAEDDAAIQASADAYHEFSAAVKTAGVVVDGPQADGTFDVYTAIASGGFAVAKGRPLTTPA